MRVVDIGDVRIGNDLPLVLIAGPCQLETEAMAVDVACRLGDIAAAEGVGFVFKSSFDKANRTSHAAPRGPGREAGFAMLAAVRAATGCPVTTDVHSPEDCAAAAGVVDLLQIPALLCRQTDLLVAAARTGLPVNVKKGQFLAPWDMVHVAEKLRAAGNDQVLLTERGTSFGYNALVSDMRALPVMAETGCPVIFDATHSVQQPGGHGAASGGERGFVAPLARAAVAVGVAGVFIESHPDPDIAPSDGPSMVPLGEMATLVADLVGIDRLRKNARVSG